MANFSWQDNTVMAGQQDKTGELVEESTTELDKSHIEENNSNQADVTTRSGGKISPEPEKGGNKEKNERPKHICDHGQLYKYVFPYAMGMKVGIPSYIDVTYRKTCTPKYFGEVAFYFSIAQTLDKFKPQNLPNFFTKITGQKKGARIQISSAGNRLKKIQEKDYEGVELEYVYKLTKRILIHTYMETVYSFVSRQNENMSEDDWKTAEDERYDLYIKHIGTYHTAESHLQNSGFSYPQLYYNTCIPRTDNWPAFIKNQQLAMEENLHLPQTEKEEIAWDAKSLKKKERSSTPISDSKEKHTSKKKHTKKEDIVGLDNGANYKPARTGYHNYRPVTNKNTTTDDSDDTLDDEEFQQHACAATRVKTTKKTSKDDHDSDDPDKKKKGKKKKDNGKSSKDDRKQPAKRGRKRDGDESPSSPDDSDGEDDQTTDSDDILEAGNRPRDLYYQAQWMTRPKDRGTFEDLPTFNGDYTQWEQFYASFKTMVHNNPELETFMKMRKLLKALRGQPALLAQKYKLTPKNYKPLVRMLKDNFGKPQYVLESYLEKIRNFPLIDNVKNPLYMEYVILLQQLEVHVKTYQPELIKSHELLLRDTRRKLPEQLRDKWEDIRLEHETTKSRDRYNETLFSKFIDFLSNKAQKVRQMQFDYKNTRGDIVATKERYKKVKGQTFVTKAQNLAINDKQTPPAKRGTAQKGRMPYNKNYQQNNSRTGFRNDAQNSRKPVAGIEYRPCELCGTKEHKPTKCAKPLGAKQLFDFVLHKKLCMNCYRSGHLTKDCRQDSQCGVKGCTRKHHARLHNYLKNRGLTPSPKKK